MKVKWILFCISIFYGTIEAIDHTSNYHDGMNIEDKMKLIALSKEFIDRMHLLQRQLLPLKLNHINSMAYQIGLIIGTMREKYKRMMEVYADCVKKRDGKSTLAGPGTWEPYHHSNMHYMIGMETVRLLEVEIHKYVDLSAKITDEDLDSDQKRMREKIMEEIKKKGHKDLLAEFQNEHGGDKPHLRNPAPAPERSALIRQSTERAGRLVETEDDVKRKYRESYMKQHGVKEAVLSRNWEYGFK